MCRDNGSATNMCGVLLFIQKNKQMATSCERALREQNIKGFLLRRDSTFNACASMGIRNL